MDESKEKSGYNWQELNSKMESEDKKLLNHLQDVLISKDHFAAI